ncbi:hypothetical protein ACJZ2D_011158 [Fusarium nematophilum]
MCEQRNRVVPSASHSQISLPPALLCKGGLTAGVRNKRSRAPVAEQSSLSPHSTQQTHGSCPPTATNSSPPATKLQNHDKPSTGLVGDALVLLGSQQGSGGQQQLL